MFISYVVRKNILTLLLLFEIYSLVEFTLNEYF